MIVLVIQEPFLEHLSCASTRLLEMEDTTIVPQDGCTSQQLGRDIEERTALQYFVSTPYVWCYNCTTGQEIVTVTDYVPTGFVVLNNAYTWTQVASELRDFGDVTTSFDVQTGEWNVSLVDRTTHNTYSAGDTNRAEAYGIVLLKAVQGQELDGTDKTSETDISDAQSVYLK